MLTHKRKGFAYITREHRDNLQLLVFSHPDSPEAGIQVPAGTIEPHETPRRGALREAGEESGLIGLKVVSFLGYQCRDMRDYDKPEIHHRYFYHLLYVGDTPDQWENWEMYPSEGRRPQHLFSLYWVDFPAGVPPLIADHGVMLAALGRVL